MYPLGLLFGLGFDTATEVGMLGLAAGVATHEVPFPGMIALPLLFAAGMSLIDTADGALMTRAYGWAVSNPARRIFYNLAVTSVSVAVALTVGTIELLQVGARTLALKGGFWGFMASLDFNRIGLRSRGCLRPRLAGQCDALEGRPPRAALESVVRLTLPTSIKGRTKALVLNSYRSASSSRSRGRTAACAQNRTKARPLDLPPRCWRHRAGR